MCFSKTASKPNKKIKPKTRIKFEKGLFKKLFSLFPILTKNYFLTLEGPFYSFGLPLFLEIMLYYVFKPLINSSNGCFGIQSWGIILLPIITVGCNGFPILVTSWKESVLMKRIASMPLSKTDLTINFLVFNFLLTFIGFYWVLSWLAILFVGDGIAKQAFSHLRWGYLNLGAVLTIITAVSFGLILAGNISNQVTAQSVGLIFYFLFTFFGGIMFPLYLIDVNKGMRIFTSFNPLKPSAFVNFYAWNDAQLKIPRVMNYQEYTSIWQPLVAALGWASIFLAIGTPTFKVIHQNK